MMSMSKKMHPSLPIHNPFSVPNLGPKKNGLPIAWGQRLGCANPFHALVDVSFLTRLRTSWMAHSSAVTAFLLSSSNFWTVTWWKNTQTKRNFEVMVPGWHYPMLDGSGEMNLNAGPSLTYVLTLTMINSCYQFLLNHHYRPAKKVLRFLEVPHVFPVCLNFP